MVLEGVVSSKQDRIILVVGNHNTKYGEYLKTKFASHPNIKFTGGIYNLNDLNSLRYHCNLYFHGHTVGGTNPSLLEAMASQALIAAHGNEFNKGLLEENAFFFTSAQQVSDLLLSVKKSDNLHKIRNNYQAIVNTYNWEKINGEYLRLFEEVLAVAK